jgi:hypothetical protein
MGTIHSLTERRESAAILADRARIAASGMAIHFPLHRACLCVDCEVVFSQGTTANCPACGNAQGVVLLSRLLANRLRASMAAEKGAQIVEMWGRAFGRADCEERKTDSIGEPA